MTDKYTQMAEEAAHEILFGKRLGLAMLSPDAQALLGAATKKIAALLRRVAREQIEEDARRAATWIATEDDIEDFERDTSFSYLHDQEAFVAWMIAHALRSRAKELED